MSTILGFIIFIVQLAAMWKIFLKMGRQGWESIIPLYNTYVLFEELYGNGWKMLLMLIPIYNIYVAIKLYIDLAHAFNKSTGFGVGLIFLSLIFTCMLGFGNAVYGDGSKSIVGDDPISATLEKVTDAAKKPGRDPEALNKIKELNELREAGVITDEEFQQKKAELLEKI